MAITASRVTTQLKRHVYPLLQDAGFEDWASRKCWRHRGERIETVEFNSFNPYHATTFGATTASVWLTFGISLSYLRYREPVSDGPNGPRPSEPSMRIRGTIAPGPGDTTSATDPPSHATADRPYLWIIASPEDAETAAKGMAAAFTGYALDWLDKEWPLEDLLQVLHTSQTEPVIETHGPASSVWLDAGLLRAAYDKSLMPPDRRQTIDEIEAEIARRAAA